MSILNRPRMSIIEADDVKMETVLQDIKNSVSFMGFNRTKNNLCQFYHSGLGEEDFTTALILLSRHIGLFDFFKLAIINTEMYRKEDGKAGVDFTPKALEYIEWKRNNFNQARINDII